jgi:hypothetical protein
MQRGDDPSQESTLVTSPSPDQRDEASPDAPNIGVGASPRKAHSQNVAASRMGKTWALATEVDVDRRSARGRQLRSYALLTAVFGSAITALAFGRRPRRHAHLDRAPLANRTPWQDLVLLGIASHKITRILTEDRVTEPIRSPFTERRGEASGKPEPVEQPATGTGLRHSLGELVTCPYCTAPWVSLAASTLYLAKPGATRIVASVFVVVSISDFLNRGYARLTA